MNDAINELGEKNKGQQYSCRMCGRQVGREQLKKETWYYHISQPEKKSPSELVFFDASDVEYLCPEHYRILPRNKAGEFVEIGYPYFASRIIQNGNIATY